MTKLERWESTEMLNDVDSHTALRNFDNEAYQLQLGEDLNRHLRVSIESFAAKLRGLRAALLAADRLARRAFEFGLVDVVATVPALQRVSSYLVATALDNAGAEDVLHAAIESALSFMPPNKATAAADGVVSLSRDVEGVRGALRASVLANAKQFVAGILPYARQAARAATEQVNAEKWNGVIRELEWLHADISRLTNYLADRLFSAAAPSPDEAPALVPASSVTESAMQDDSDSERKEKTRFELLEVE